MTIETLVISDVDLIHLVLDLYQGVVLTLAVIMMILLLVLAIYVYTSLALMKIGKRLKYKHSWLAWIPIANFAMILEMGGFHWAWVFLILIPILGAIALFVLLIISMWRIFEKRKYPGWLALTPAMSLVPVIGWILSPFFLIASLVILGLVAWQDK